MQIQHYQIRLKTGIFFKNMSEDGLFNIYLMNYFLSFLIFSRKSSIKSVVSLSPLFKYFCNPFIIQSWKFFLIKYIQIQYIWTVKIEIITPTPTFNKCSDFWNESLISSTQKIFFISIYIVASTHSTNTTDHTSIL